jgi:hypothetical protein
MEEQEFVAFVTLCLEEHREKDALAVIHEQVKANPCLSLPVRALYYEAYSQPMTAIREQISAITHYSQIDLSHNRLRRADFILAKRDKLCQRLIAYAREAVSMIESVLLPHAADLTAVVFFHKMIAEIERCIAECDIRDESAPAALCAERAYNTAMETALRTLPANDPLRLQVALSAATFHCSANVGTAAEIMDAALREYAAIPRHEPEARAIAREIARRLSQIEPDRVIATEEEEEEPTEPQPPEPESDTAEHIAPAVAVPEEEEEEESEPASPTTIDITPWGRMSESDEEEEEEERPAINTDPLLPGLD